MKKRRKKNLFFFLFHLKGKSIYVAYLIEDVCGTTTSCTCIAFVSVYSPGLHQQHRQEEEEKKRRSSYKMLTR
jgi:hypothetical protein